MKNGVTRSRIRLITIASVCLALAGMGIAPAQEETSDAVKTPKIAAVKFHADWCGHCKAMGPVFEELQAKFDQQPVLWLTLDHTREHDRRQSEYLASALELEEVWSEYGGKTGFILLIDTESREVVDKLTHDLSLKEMGARLTAAVS